MTNLSLVIFLWQQDWAFKAKTWPCAHLFFLQFCVIEGYNFVHEDSTIFKDVIISIYILHAYMYMTCTLHVYYVHTIGTQHTKNMHTTYNTCMQYACHIKHACSIHTTCIRHVCNTHKTCIRLHKTCFLYTHNIHLTCM